MTLGIGILTDGRDPSGRPHPALVPGTLIVAYLLATGRWGSYLDLHLPGVYVSDVVVALTVVGVLVRHRHFVRAPRHVVVALVPLAALLAWAALRLVTGRDLSIVALRDAAPYGYAAFAGVSSLVTTGEAARRRTLHVLTAALLVHLLWVTLSVLVPSLSPRLPLVGGRVHLFEVRPDFDGAVLAMLAGVALHGVLTQSGRVRRSLALGVGAWSAGLVLQLANRAALLSLLVCGALVLVADRGQIAVIPVRRVAPVALVLLVAVVVLLPQSSLYRRLSGDPEFATNAAASTQRSRVWAWQDVLDYVDDSPSRVVLGTGFGPDYVWTSGAALRLEGPGNFGVRAPHSFPLNTYARLGLVGAALLTWILAQWARSLWAVVAHPRSGATLLLLAALVGWALLVASLVGVILESPFGALPFFWTLGLILRAAGNETLTPARDEVPAVLHAAPAPAAS